MTTPVFVPALEQSLRRKRRFLIVGVAFLMMLGVTMGVSFLDNSGTTAVAISAAPSTAVWPLGGTSTALPSGSGAADPLRSTAFSGTTTTLCSPAVTNATYCLPSVVSPAWSGSTGTYQVSSAGDLAIVDGSTATNYVTVNVYITNLAALLVDYSSFAFPINVYTTTCSSTACSAWTADSTAVSQTNFGSYLTDTQPELTFTLQAGAGVYYDIVMEGANHFYNGTTVSPAGAPQTGPGSTTTGVGGALVITQTSGTNGSLSPNFFFTASES